MQAAESLKATTAEPNNSAKMQYRFEHCKAERTCSMIGDTKASSRP